MTFGVTNTSKIINAEEKEKRIWQKLVDRYQSKIDELEAKMEEESDLQERDKILTKIAVKQERLNYCKDKIR